jgi:3-oxoacid CoA-transferase A subunit
MNKVVVSAREAIVEIGDSATIMVGGFGLCGIPENLIQALKEKGTRNLTIISNSAGVDDFGVSMLLGQRQVRKMISSFVGENQFIEELVLKGELEIELVPEGTLAERIRAGGAGIGAFYTPTGFGTISAEGKESRSWNGRHYVMEMPLRADFAFVKAWKGDCFGNLIYRKTARNFNPVMAAAAEITLAEVEQLVEPEEMDPNFIHTPGLYVKKIFQGSNYQKRIENERVD